MLRASFFSFEVNIFFFDLHSLTCSVCRKITKLFQKVLKIEVGCFQNMSRRVSRKNGSRRTVLLAPYWHID